MNKSLDYKPQTHHLDNILFDVEQIPITAHINSYYYKPGQWMQDFTESIQKTSFNMDDYLGDFLIYKN